MANREEYRFDVNANTEQASEAVDQLINKFSKLERTINNINKKGLENNYTTNQKDMDKSMRSYKEMADYMVNASKYVKGAINKSYRDIERIKPPKMPRHPNQVRQEPVKPKDPRKNASKEALTKYKQDMDEYTKAYEKYQKRMSSYEKRMSSYNSQMQQYQKEKGVYDERVKAHENFVSRMESSYRKLDSIMKKANNAHLDTQGFEQNYSKNFDHKLNKNGIYNMPDNPNEAKHRMRAIFEGKDELEYNNRQVRNRITTLRQMRSRNESLSRRGAAQGYMSYQQAQNFHSDYVKSQTDLRGERDQNFTAAGKLGTRRRRLQGMVDAIEQNPEKYGDDSFHKKAGYQRNIEAIDEEIENRRKLNQEIEQTISDMQVNRNRLLENKVDVDAKRGSFARNMTERSAAIGLAMGGTIAGTFTNMYQQGQSIDQATRDQQIYFGQSSGMNGKDWSKWEEGLINQSKNNHSQGFTAQQQMQFMSDYMGNAGFKSVGDVSSAVSNMGNFSRATGIDANTTSKFFGTMANTGGMNGSQMKDFQDAFLGAIKESGMDGRQQQQLEALQNIVSNVGANKQLSNSQVNSIVGMQGLLASSGNRSLQGQNGANFMNQMNAGIQGSFDNPQMRLIFGAGTKYKGGAGMWQLEKQMNAGIVGKDGLNNLQAMTNYSKQNAGGNKDYERYIFSMLSKQMGMNLTTDQIDSFMTMADKGQLTEKNVNAFEKKAKAAGKKAGAKNSDSYGSSEAATNNQSDATSQAQAKALYDNTIAIRQLNNVIGKLPWEIYGVLVAAGALTGMMSSTLGGFGFSTGIKKIFGKRFGTTIGNLADGPLAKDAEGNPIPVGPDEAPKGFVDRNAPNRTARAEAEKAYNTANGKPNEPVDHGRILTDNPPKVEPVPTGPTTFWGKATSKIGGGFKGAAGDVSKFFTENPFGKVIGKGMGTAWKVAGKVAPWLAVAGGVAHVATAKKGQHITATGEAAGGVGGMFAGAKVGAGLGARVGFGIGKFFGPEGAAIGGVAGTVLGTLGGGIAGSSIGKRIGGWVGGGAQKVWNGVTGLFHHDKSKDKGGSSSSGHSSPASKKQDQHTTNVKAQTEDKRTKNIQTESFNLGTNSKQITQMQQLLATARQQNGIIGTLTGTGSGSGSIGSVSGSKGAAGMTNAKGNQASIWNYFAQQGYSSSAIAGIMGNIGTETGGTFDPTTQQKGGPGMGLAQWTKGQRWSQLQAWAKQNGMDPMAMSTQLQFMSKEMNGMGLTPQAMNGMSVGQATSAFEQQYEGAGTPNMSSRNNYANQAYSQFANSPQVKPSLQQMTGTTATVNSNINVNLTGSGDAVNQISSNSQLQNLGQKLQQMIYGSMGYYSTDTTRA